nr:MAG TPA: hypothetical protein [Caudoviricetes sp.]
MFTANISRNFRRRKDGITRLCRRLWGYVVVGYGR